jgi:hypothetical protein
VRSVAVDATLAATLAARVTLPGVLLLVDPRPGGSRSPVTGHMAVMMIHSGFDVRRSCERGGR